MDRFSSTWVFWTVPVLVALALFLLNSRWNGSSTVFDVFWSLLIGAVPIWLILGFVRGDGMSDKSFAISALTLSAIPILVVLTAKPDQLLAYPATLLGAAGGAVAALRYDIRLQEQDESPRPGLLMLYILGGAAIIYLPMRLL